MKKTRLSTLAAITAVAALLVPATPALAQHEGPISAKAVALMATQDELHEVAGRIGKGSGFSGFYVDAATKTLNVHWKGTVPAKARTEAVVARAKGLKVRFHPAKHSQAELRAEADRLTKADTSITGVTVKYDGSGLVVKQTTSGFSAKSAPRSSVAVEVETGAVELAASRNADSPLYKGGAFIRNVDWQQSCSSGFAVVSNPSNTEGLLTAAHCGWLSTTYNNGAGQLIGTVGTVTAQSDGAVISASGEPKVWIGDSIQNEANQYGLDVVGADETLPGDWLCTSGAFSGTICEIRAVQTGLQAWFEGFGMVFDLVEAVHTGGYSAGGNGDSGGPVFSVRQPGDKLVARGTLTAISTKSADIRQCSGVPAGVGRQCSQKILFPDITKQLRHLDARIKTVS
ncbi:hypothetical protein SK803_31645 [Lentzea sp. BCCO 10_0856]|uniref:Streptogrisin C n=1 Tax=Lentzea miocenica TaxID=3095431 RepID=A0ABU4TA52_9PSEU|nr:hypothetical protein [Lentzea sp. BCCO 10_0856]MDX8034793.1 hypothetical protein [Lentzea sp. BCCO 10_0856]